MTRSWFKKSCQHANDGALTSAIWSEESKNFTLFNDKVYAVNGGDEVVA